MGLILLLPLSLLISWPLALVIDDVAVGVNKVDAPKQN